MAEEKKYLGQAAVERLIANTRAEIAAGDEATLAAAKEHAENLGVNYDPAGTATTKVQELANGQVKENTDAISAINDENTGLLKQAKDYADGKDEAIAAAQGAADAAQSDVDAVEGRMDTAEGEITTIKSQIAALEAGTYDDSEVRELIQDNADDIDALEGRASTVEGQIATLIGDDTNKSARTIANEELAKQLIAENAAESLNELQEIAKWIQDHPNDASAMNKAISDLAALVGALPDGVSATTIVDYIQEVVNAEKARSEAAESGLDTRMSTVESNLGEGTVDSRITAAKNEAVSTAASDATSKADQALSDAKAYADGKVATIDLSGINTNANEITGLKTRMSTAETDIDNLEKAISVGGSVAVAIEDAKKAGTDAQSSVDSLKNGEVATLTSNVSTLQSDVATLKSVTYTEITADEIDAMFA